MPHTAFFAVDVIPHCEEKISAMAYLGKAAMAYYQPHVHWPDGAVLSVSCLLPQFS